MASLDHIVVMAESLDQGVAWCEATLGVSPGPGGEHPLMGTHNRLLCIASENFPRAYLEIIAINKAASYPITTGAKRWFDMDDAALTQRVAQNGPQLVHFVASVPDIHAAVQALDAQGIQRGKVIQASRVTPAGVLQWHITVRDDGWRLLEGCLPTLIQWGDVHPTDNMPESGISLHALQITHPQAEILQAALDAPGISLAQVTVKKGLAQLAASLHTPRGEMQLFS